MAAAPSPPHPPPPGESVHKFSDTELILAYKTFITSIITSIIVVVVVIVILIDQIWLQVLHTSGSMRSVSLSLKPLYNYLGFCG